MVHRPENSPVKTDPPISQDNAQKSDISRIPFPKPTQPLNYKREIKARVLTGEGFINIALDRLKSTFIVKFFKNLFSESKASSPALTIDEAKNKILADGQFAKKFAAGLSLFMNKEEARQFFISLADQYKNLNDSEKENLNQFISTFVKTADPDDIEYVDAPLQKLFIELRSEDIKTRSDTIMDQFSYLISPPQGKASLEPDLDKVRRGEHLNRDDCLEIMASSLKTNSKALISQVRTGEIAEFSRNGENGKLPSLQSALEDSNRLMAAIKNDILQDSDQKGIKNSLEFYIELANHLHDKGDAHSFIIILAVLLDPEMDGVLKNANISDKHRSLLEDLEKKAALIDSVGHIPERPEIPSLYLLVDRSKDLVNQGDLNTVTDNVLAPLENAFNAIEDIKYSKEAPFYNVKEFVQFRSQPTDVKKNREALEADITQIYTVLEKADSSQKLRITPDGLIAKDRSILSRFTSRLAGKKEPAQHAVQHVLAKIDRALDQDPAPLEKIGHIINFLKSHSWSKIVLNKNDELNAALNRLEQKYLSKVDSKKEAQNLHNRTKNGIEMVYSFLKDIDDTRHIVIMRGISGGYNLRASRDSVSKETLNNFLILLKDASNDAELKTEVLELFGELLKRPWFEEALKNHKSIGDEIIQLGRVMSQKWITPEEAGNVPQ